MAAGQAHSGGGFVMAGITIRAFAAARPINGDASELGLLAREGSSQSQKQRRYDGERFHNSLTGSALRRPVLCLSLDVVFQYDSEKAA
jgi:hypothetical protein